MTIQVLGSGCSTCKKLYEITKETAQHLSLQQEVEYVSGSEGMKKIVELGLMSSPVLVVNGEVAMVGFSSDMKVIQEKILSILNKK